jgi:hypothetical protein
MATFGHPTWMHAALTSAWQVAAPWLGNNQSVSWTRAKEAVVAGASAAAITVAQAMLTGLTDMFVHDLFSFGRD